MFIIVYKNTVHYREQNEGLNMKLYLTTITLLLLTACGGGFQTGLATAQVNGALEREEKAMDEANALSEIQCQSTNPDRQRASIEYRKCWMNIVERDVVPVAYDPILARKALNQLKLLVIQREQGEISEEEEYLKGQQVLLNYQEAKRVKAMGTLNRANQIDMQVAQQQQQYFQNLSQQIQQQEIANQQAFERDMPTQTTCNAVAGSMNCTTW